MISNESIFDKLSQFDVNMKNMESKITEIKDDSHFSQSTTFINNELSTDKSLNTGVASYKNNNKNVSEINQSRRPDDTNKLRNDNDLYQNDKTKTTLMNLENKLRIELDVVKMKVEQLGTEVLSNRGILDDYHKELRTYNDKIESSDKNNHDSTNRKTSLIDEEVELGIKDKIHLLKAVEKLKYDQSVLKQKLKDLNDNTSKACRSLSFGLESNQKLAIGLLTWSEHVYLSFGIICDKLFMPNNICSRIQASMTSGGSSGDLNLLPFSILSNIDNLFKTIR